MATAADIPVSVKRAPVATVAVEVSVVMPCLNEAETLGRCIETAQRALREMSAAGEVVVADNGSSDGSQEIARRLGARVIAVPVRGYGAALRTGIEGARGRYVVFADADGSYDFAEVPHFAASLREGYDVVIGDRFRGGIHAGAMPWLHRYVGNPLLSSIGRLLFWTPVRDFHCGLRGLSKAAFERLELASDGMEFASEMVVKAAQRKLRIAELPVELRPDGRSRRPHLRPWRDGWRHLRLMLRLFFAGAARLGRR
ncbi:MAG: glycosyltransferase family 2 protein [Planctomycetes bacterium]|nr:glycosyltransferase family 2 protein [Planctomycetota bacterium]